MANTQERRERMLRLLGLRERWKVGELAREFGVTERTILRDVEQLSLTKPICTEPGRHGGVWLTEHSARPTLTVEETAALRRALAVKPAPQAKECPPRNPSPRRTCKPSARSSGITKKTEKFFSKP